MKKWLMLLSVLLLLTACSGEKEESGNVGTKAGTFPLTGIETDEGADNRIVAVMINNSPEARPQTGLNEADIVFEMLTEGNITRLLALYQSEYPQVVGPVRSSREYYFRLAQDYNAIYVYHGAAGFINDMIEDSGVEFLNGTVYDNDGNLFKRESFREAPHNSYLQFGALPEVAKEQGYEMIADYDSLPFLSEEEKENMEGESVSAVQVNYSSSAKEAIKYAYDPSEQLYHRFIGEVQTVDYETDEPIELENIFIIEAAHEVIDDQGRREVDLSTGGNAYLLQQGKLQQLEWSNEEGKIIPVIDGQPVGFVPGKTWVHVVPELDAVTALSAGNE